MVWTWTCRRCPPHQKALDAEFAGKAELIYTEGCDFDGNDTSKFSEALAVARKADVILLCMGEKKSGVAKTHRVPS